eukprot:TRINITY_DN3354_c0_g1_i1.p1 TRINITY_DN3354_c0_g1~~TRINITY_DN3354_c0_g1_i1.p1  ORF type:complete len:284 (-),score=45.89 TRINITY_DN3354_c0_g1_i1:23-874(-)
MCIRDSINAEYMGFLIREAIINNNIAVCYKQKQEPIEVAKYASKVIDSGCEDRDIILKAYILRAFANENLDRLRKAKDDWTKVKEIHPMNLDASKALARLQTALNQDAAREAASAISESLRNLDEFKNNGNALFKSGNYLEAINEYSRGIDLFKLNVDLSKIHLVENTARVQTACQLFTNRSLCYFNVGKHKEAIEDADYVITNIDQKNAKAYFRKGMSLAKIGRKGEAKAALQRAVALFPTSTLYRDELQKLQIQQPIISSCLLYTSPSPRDLSTSRMPSSA